MKNCCHETFLYDGMFSNNTICSLARARIGGRQTEVKGEETADRQTARASGEGGDGYTAPQDDLERPAAAGASPPPEDGSAGRLPSSRGGPDPEEIPESAEVMDQALTTLHGKVQDQAEGSLVGVGGYMCGINQEGLCAVGTSFA